VGLSPSGAMSRCALQRCGRRPSSQQLRLAVYLRNTYSEAVRRDCDARAKYSQSSSREARRCNRISFLVTATRQYLARLAARTEARDAPEPPIWCTRTPLSDPLLYINLTNPFLDRRDCRECYIAFECRAKTRRGKPIEYEHPLFSTSVHLQNLS
jgi:hypothetical protein